MQALDVGQTTRPVARGEFFAIVLLVDVVRVRDNAAIGTHGVGQNLGVVASAGEKVEHMHPRLETKEAEKCNGLAGLVALPVGGASNTRRQPSRR